MLKPWTPGLSLLPTFIREPGDKVSCAAVKYWHGFKSDSSLLPFPKLAGPSWDI